MHGLDIGARGNRTWSWHPPVMSRKSDRIIFYILLQGIWITPSQRQLAKAISHATNMCQYMISYVSVCGPKCAAALSIFDIDLLALTFTLNETTGRHTVISQRVGCHSSSEWNQACTCWWLGKKHISRLEPICRISNSGRWTETPAWIATISFCVKSRTLIGKVSRLAKIWSLSNC